MAEILQHLRGHRADVDLLERDAERLAELVRVRLRVVARREARHRVRQDVGARASEAVHRLGRDDERVRRVETTRDTDDDLRLADRAHALLECADLDLVRLVAVLGEAGFVGGHEREALDLALETEVGVRHTELERDLAQRSRRAEAQTVVVVAAVALTRLADGTEVDVRDAGARALGEALSLGEQGALVVDHRLAVPREVGGRLALAAGRVDVRRQRAERLALNREAALGGLTDGDGRTGEVHEDARTREGGLGRRRDRHPYVLADLDVDGQIRQVECSEDEVGTEGHLAEFLAEVDVLTALILAERVPALLVELAVVGQVALRHDAENLTLLDDDGAVVEALALTNRRADDGDGREPARTVDDGGDRAQHVVEQHVLHDEVLDAVTAEVEFGVDRGRHTLVVQLTHRLENALGVRHRVGERNGVSDRRDAGESVRVQGTEVHGSQHVRTHRGRL